MNNFQFNDKFISRLQNARSIVFFTGAGISAESGISTFRGEDGLWNRLKPEELASFDAFMRNPNMVWEWYQYRRKIVHNAEPNLAHKAIKDFEKYFDNVTVVTQNIDNLHYRAGTKNIFELHGNIERNYCMDCKTFFDESEIQKYAKVPHCKMCGGMIRPDVVWFGEFLPHDQFEGGERAAAKCDICFVVGTSAVVYPAARIPLTAKKNGAYIVEINIEETEMTYTSDYSIFGKAGDILPAIVNLLLEIKYGN